VKLYDATQGTITDEGICYLKQIYLLDVSSDYTYIHYFSAKKKQKTMKVILRELHGLVY
jgi:hypothetical protein